MNDLRNRNPRPQQRRPANARNGRPPSHRPQNGGGNARRNYERYLELAREATVKGDPVEAENCYQHAEHYFRTMRESEAGRGE